MKAHLVGMLFAGLLAWLVASSAAPIRASTQESTGGRAMPAEVRPGLPAIPLPPFDTLEPEVNGQIRQAIRDLEAEAGGSDRALSEGFGALGQIFHAYEIFDAAEACYLNAAQLSRGDVRWPHLLGYLYLQTGRAEDAVEHLRAARRARPSNHAAAVRLGEAYLQLNRLSDAREQFESVAAALPAVARNGLGEIALRQRRFAEAAEHFRAVLERAPQAASVHYSLAMAYRGLGRLDEARLHLQRRGQGGIRPADPIVDSLQQLVRGERGLVNQGRRAYEAGRFKEAAEAFGRAVAAAPASAAARVNLGLSYSQLGNAAAAVEQFEAALRIDAGNVMAHAGLGVVLARQRRDAEAIEHLRAAVDGAADGVDVRGELVGALLRLGLTDEAIQVLDRARAADPDDEDTLLGLALLLADRGRFADALALLDGAHRRFPERTATATTLARLLASSPDRSLRDGRRALDLAKAVHAAAPSAAHGETVALALAELGRCAEAADWIRRAAADAGRARDTAEVARLRGEVPKYTANSCRPPGQ